MTLMISTTTTMSKAKSLVSIVPCWNFLGKVVVVVVVAMKKNFQGLRENKFIFPEAVEFVPSTSVQEFQHKIHKSAQIRKTTQRNSVGRRGKPILPSKSI